MKTPLVAGGRRNLMVALFAVLALTLALSSAVFADGDTTVTPPYSEVPPCPLVQPPDTTGTQQPSNPAVTTYQTVVDILVTVLNII